MNRDGDRKADVDSRSDYDLFARVYDRHWGGFADGILPVLDRLIPGKLAEGARVLDLCCGTGRLAATLTRRGCEVIGVDVSEAMIDLARHNAPDAEFMVADARSFTVGEPVGVVVSTYDSLNHIMSASDLADVFGRVGDALVEGGSFVFDLNTEDGYQARWRGSFGIATDTEVVVVRPRYDQEERIGTMELTVMTLDDGAWSRTDVALAQRCHEEGEVLGALAGAGFGSVEVVAATEMDWAEVGRSLYVSKGSG